MEGFYGTAGEAFDGKELAKTVFAEIDGVLTERTWILEDDYSAYLRGLGPGDTIEPQGMKPKTDEGRTKLKERCREAEGNIENACSHAMDVAHDEMTEPPSPEALAYVSALKDRNVTIDEVEHALRRYGGNWTCYQIMLSVIEEQRKAGRAEFYRLDPRNTLDNYEAVTRNIKRQADYFLENVAEGRYRDSATLERRAGQLELSLSYIADNGGREPFADDFHSISGIASFDRMNGFGRANAGKAE